MSTWSGMRAKLERECLAPSLRGRVQYFATTYNKCPDHEGRAAVRLDGKEILKSSYYEYCQAEYNAQRAMAQSGCAVTVQESHKVSRQAAIDGGDFDQVDFYNAFGEFDNQSIEMSLASANPIVRMFAVLDKRVGKRKLVSLSGAMESELSWIRIFYRLRCDAENIALQPSTSDI